MHKRSKRASTVASTVATTTSQQAVRLHNLGLTLLQNGQLEQASRVLSDSFEYLSSNASLETKIEAAQRALQIPRPQMADVRVWKLDESTTPCLQTTHVLFVSSQLEGDTLVAIMLFNYATCRLLQGNLGDAWHNYVAAKEKVGSDVLLIILILQALVRLGPRLYRKVEAERQQLNDLLRRRHMAQSSTPATARIEIKDKESVSACRQ